MTPVDSELDAEGAATISHNSTNSIDLKDKCNLYSY
jgi:hypothetical protein